MYQTAFQEDEKVTQMWNEVLDIITADESAWVSNPDSNAPMITVLCDSKSLSAEKLIKHHGYNLSIDQGTNPEVVRVTNFCR